MLQLIIIQAVTFIILLIVLRSLFQKQLDVALRRLKVLHQQNLVKETQLKEEIEKARVERLAQVDKGKEEAKNIVETAKKEADRLHNGAESQARVHAEGIVQKGKEEVEKIRRNLDSEVESQALDLSVKMIKHLFTAKGKEALQHQFIEEIIKEIRDIDESKFSVKEENVVVESSYSLKPEEKEKIQTLLSEKMGLKIQLEENVKPELICGLVIQIGALIIDGSLQNKLKKIVPYLKRS